MTRALILAGLAAAGGLSCREQPGEQFTETALGTPAASAESADPALALDPSTGDLLLTWVGGDSSGWSLFFARSIDEGATWSEPRVVVAGGDEVHPHGESSPRLVAANGGRVALAWARSISVPGRKWPATQIRLSRSLDGGVNWSQPVTLNDDSAGTPAGHQFHGAAWSGDSGLVVSWLDERSGPALEIHHGGASPTAGDVTDEPDAVVFSATSSDFGATWGRSNQLLWGQACPCCRISLARNPEGRVISAWRKHYPGNIRDVVTAPVDSGGVEPARVNRDNWVYPGCPHTGPGLSVGNDGAAHVVWYVGKEGSAGVYYQRVQAETTKPTPLALLQARTLPAAHTTVAALPGGGALAAYDMTQSGDRAIGVSLISANRTVERQHVISGSEGGQYPQVMGTGPGRAVVAYTATENGRRQVRVVGFRFEADNTGARVALKE
jgi:hypothetical protein